MKKLIKRAQIFGAQFVKILMLTLFFLAAAAILVILGYALYQSYLHRGNGSAYMLPYPIAMNVLTGTVCAGIVALVAGLIASRAETTLEKLRA